ncbi:MAG: SulP family inorganic anion transporter [Trueperaceae bacterium]|nr:SulP family inorganic anion transporter [Trueperaceae bacterium]
MDQAKAFKSKRTFPRFYLADLLAGISVALVAIPQGMAYAELAAVPAYTGLYAVAFASIAAAFFVSSPYLQTGPVATTSLLTFGVLSHLAVPNSPYYLELAGLLAILVGVVRVLVGVLKLGRIAYLMSQPVLMGFTTAAAFLIFTSQIPTFLGATAPGNNILARAFFTLIHPGQWHLDAIALALASMLVIHLSRRVHPLFPGILVAVVLGLGVAFFLPYHSAVIGQVPSGLPAIDLTPPVKAIPNLLVGALVIAFVGFAEAASISRTYATQDRSSWSADQEFISQGVANVAAGFFGGFPVGGSFSRSSVSRLAGTKTRWSGLVAGLLVLAFLPFTFILSYLPKAVLAAIVIMAVIKLLRFRELYRLRNYSKTQAYIAWITFVLSIVLSPRIDLALLIGISLAVAHHLRREQKVFMDIWEYADTLHVKPKGVLWFGSSANVEEQINEALSIHKGVKKLEFHLGGVGRVDLSAALMLKRLQEDAEKAGLEVEFSGIPPMARSWVKRIWED